MPDEHSVTFEVGFVIWVVYVLDPEKVMSLILCVNVLVMLGSLSIETIVPCDGARNQT